MKNLLSFDLDKMYEQVHSPKFVPAGEWTWPIFNYFYCNSNQLNAYSSKQLANKFMKLTDIELESAIQGLLAPDYYHSMSSTSNGIHRQLPTIKTVRHLLERTQKWIDENVSEQPVQTEFERTGKFVKTETTSVSATPKAEAPKDFPFKFESVNAVFTDYKGDMRNFTMVAVSVPMQTGTDVIDAALRRIAKRLQGASEKEINKIEIRTAEVAQPVGKGIEKIALKKGLYFGIAVTKAEDTNAYSPEVGLRIALGRALNANKPENVHALFSTHPGMFSTESVRALLVNEANYFIENPGSYMGGYNEARDKYLASQKASK